MPRTATRWRHMQMPFFPEKKGSTGALYSESRWRLAERGTRGGPLVRTGAAPEERRSKTKARRDRERWSVSRAPRTPCDEGR
ncbi:hypothetical protein NDU88_001056 [Pleurodeles waltl]|uniref:Uncharacterized protein n=1 Tax=Pleurodeles waltl TaxID=8319 RepID=A0AAV7U5T4_PLEWA|nr:hypothetical protein NDU88_001056 [Pleurodeles waltl]